MVHGPPGPLRYWAQACAVASTLQIVELSTVLQKEGAHDIGKGTRKFSGGPSQDAYINDKAPGITARGHYAYQRRLEPAKA